MKELNESAAQSVQLSEKSSFLIWKSITNVSKFFSLPQVTIVVIPNTNAPPEFDSDTYYPDPVLAPKLAGYLVINLEDSASDPDDPLTAVGEIEFEEVSEKRTDTGQGMSTQPFRVIKTLNLKGGIGSILTPVLTLLGGSHFDGHIIMEVAILMVAYGGELLYLAI